MQNEHGGSRLKLIIFLAVFGLIIYVGYMYIPVSVDAYYYKDIMQNKVDMAAAQGFDGNWVRDQLVKSGPEYHVPPDMTVTSILKEGRLEVRVQFIRPISFPGYTYNYEFDHTARSSGFLTK
jgi:hypothetical protein